MSACEALADVHNVTPRLGISQEWALGLKAEKLLIEQHAIYVATEVNGNVIRLCSVKRSGPRPDPGRAFCEGLQVDRPPCRH